jgi:hypothetical protein
MKLNTLRRRRGGRWNKTTFIFSTGHVNALRVPPNDRRFWFVPISRTPEEHRFNMLAYGEDVKLPPEAPAGDVPSR